MSGTGAPWPEVAFEAAPGKRLGLAFGGLLFAGGCAAALLGGLVPWASVEGAALAFGIPFFGLAAALWLRAALQRGVVLRIGRAGVHDARLGAETVPWSAIRRLSTWSHQGQRFLVLDVDEALHDRLAAGAWRRLMRAGNRRLGLEGLLIGAQGLRGGSFEDLERAVIAGLTRAEAERTGAKDAGD